MLGIYSVLNYAIAGRKHLVHHPNRRLRTKLRIAVFGVDRQVVLDLLEACGEQMQAIRESVVADGDVGFEAGFVTEELVVVGFVGADGDIERRVEIHPGHVARVIVVGEEGVGAQAQILAQRSVAGELGGFAEELGGALEVVGVSAAVRDDGEFLIGAAADDGEEADGGSALGFGQGFEPGFELVAGHIGGIEIAFGNAGNEGGVGVEIAPRAFIQPEVVQPRLAERRGVFLELRVEVAIGAPELVHENEIEDLRCVDEFGERLTVAGRELRGVVLDFDRRKAGGHLLELRKIGHNGGGQEKDEGLHGFIVAPVRSRFPELV